MRRAVPTLLVLGLAAGAQAQPPSPADPPACRVVRLSDVGWTDVTATTAVVAHVLRTLGYEPRVTVLSVPVTFASLRNGDVDVFLGNWMPSQQEMLAPYLADGSIDVVATNLRGARYTLAVPAYLHDAGLRDFRDIARFRDALGGAIHGIEPGNEANETLLAMIRKDALGLGGFRLVESSEQGMLAEVERAVRAPAAHRVPRLGSAPDEHAVPAAVPERRRRLVRPRLRGRHRPHAHAPPLRRRVPQRRPSPAERHLHGRRRERADGRHPHRSAWQPPRPPRRGSTRTATASATWLAGVTSLAGAPFGQTSRPGRRDPRSWFEASGDAPQAPGRRRRHATRRLREAARARSIRWRVAGDRVRGPHHARHPLGHPRAPPDPAVHRSAPGSDDDPWR